ncbi:histidine phosphatase family protein [Streptomyces sp. 142MFCol3.1]|uniref:histidine phosphatase family protein n=1 Tax=Streptomyces sp. 142MFCol3.1 TaxID=1172179 RepID=UPI00099687CB|nr:histidine phosphatase family protein [Streptomyces sp. 142MFCol3.1]
MTIRLTLVSAPRGDAAVDRLLGDAPLSERGVRRAGAGGAALPLHRMAVRAPSVRCAQTADAFGLVAAVEPALRDLDLGTWCGRTVDDIAAADPDGFSAWLTDPDAAPHEGESVRRLCRRTADWMNSVAPDTGHVVAITEAAVVRAALVHALAAPARAFWRLAVPPLSPVSLTWRGGHWDVRLGYATGRENQRRFLAPSATLARGDSDQFEAAHLSAPKRSSSFRGTVFAGCG